MNRFDSVFTRAQRALAIARYYSWYQIALRGKSILLRKLLGPPRVHELFHTDCQPNKQLDAEFFSQTLQHWHERWNNLEIDLKSGTFSLINVTHAIGSPAEWETYFSNNNVSHLWRFQFQYHEFLLPLIANQTDSDPGISETWQFIQNWIDTYHSSSKSNRSDAWHPYCISRRIPAWLTLLATLPANQNCSVILDSLVSQTEHLQSHCEHDLGGNHLLENYFALAFSGLCLDVSHSRKWLVQAEHGLEKQLDLQILSHGEHYELSPMYHCHILSQCLRIARLASGRATSLRETCLRHARKMLAFLIRILHTDGEIPLLGDSGFGEAASVQEIRWLAQENGLVIDRPTLGLDKPGPYRVFRNETGDSLICDFGEVATNALPAHGHCDLLGLEASVQGTRWFVDSGNFNYEDDAMRHYCRSSAAHNVMTVAGQNQCDIWSKFRMGRRGRILDRSDSQDNGWQIVRAAHDGYRKMGVPRMERLIAVHSDQVWICADFAKGDPKSLDGYLHLAPDIEAKPVKDGDGQVEGTAFLLSDGNQQRIIRFFGTKDVVLKSGWLCEKFGLRLKTSVLAYKQDQYHDQPIGWMLFPVGYDCQISSFSRTLSVTTDQTTSWKFDL